MSEAHWHADVARWSLAGSARFTKRTSRYFMFLFCILSFFLFTYSPANHQPPPSLPPFPFASAWLWWCGVSPTRTTSAGAAAAVPPVLPQTNRRCFELRRACLPQRRIIHIIYDKGIELPHRESTLWASSSPPPGKLLHGHYRRSRPPLPDAIVIRASFWAPLLCHPVALGRSRAARRCSMSPRRRGRNLGRGVPPAPSCGHAALPPPRSLAPLLQLGRPELPENYHTHICVRT
jgi:hypothetical protein